ncbi:MAG TPA: BMP family ABC transporter substrate-binding protein [Gaiellaceae bacterium]|nr:BMP family ABC transporter substrate-binding protein [Gaiellaceae bacterium]
MRNRKLALAAILLVVAAAAVVLALGTSPGTAKSTAAYKAAWIYVGPHNDGGWSQAHDQGRLYVQKALGSKVQTTYKENVPEGPQVAQVIEQLIRDGNKIIFATSFGFQPAMAAAAAKHPDVKFEMATGTIIKPNMAEYYGAGEDAIYLSGIAAGAATKTGTVGYVVPFAIPEVIRHTNAFTLGVQKAHPGAKVKIVWTNSWFDPAKEKKAAESLHAAGADVIGQNVDSPSAGQYSESAGIPWVGYDSDAKKFAPKSWLTAAVYNWGPYYLKRVRAAMNGTWKTGNYYGSLKDGFTKLAPFGKGVSAKTKSLIAQQEKLLKGGKWNEFSGPIYDQKGKVRIAKGHRPSFNDLYSMSYLVKGVIGSPKG